MVFWSKRLKELASLIDKKERMELEEFIDRHMRDCDDVIRRTISDETLALEERVQCWRQ